MGPYRSDWDCPEPPLAGLGGEGTAGGPSPGKLRLHTRLAGCPVTRGRVGILQRLFICLVDQNTVVNFILGLMQADHDVTLMISGETCAKVDWTHSHLPSMFTANTHCSSLPASLLWTRTLHITDHTLHIHWSLLYSHNYLFIFISVYLLHFHLSIS